MKHGLGENIYKIYLTNDSYPKHTKKNQNSIIRRYMTPFFKWVKGVIAHERCSTLLVIRERIITL